MIASKLKILILTLLFLPVTGSISLKNSLATQPKSCLESIINDDFSNDPLGLKQQRFRKSFLTDTLFNKVLREECKQIRHQTDISHTIQFFPGKSVFLFISGQEEENYFLQYADIQDNNSPLKIKISDRPVGINFTKDFIQSRFKLARTQICDIFAVYSSERDVKHTFYFKNDLVHRIKLYSN